MTPFRERNPIPIGVASLLVLALIGIMSFRLDSVPFLTSTAGYSARFREAAGIDRENEVRIAGVRVGKVTGVRLDGDRVVVDFDIDSDVELGTETRAAIKLKTLLGTKYLELTSDGPGRLDEGAEIPVDRTEVPFQIYEAFDELSTSIDEIDTELLGKSLQVLAATFGDPKGNTRRALEGLSRLSTTIASRDAELRRLLASTRTVTGALSARDAELAKLLGDADLVLQTLERRREIIAALLRDSSELARQLTALVRENRAQVDPLLADLHRVVEVLGANLDQLEKSVSLLGPLARYGANSTGNGRWLDVYSENLVVSDEILCQLGACD